MNIKDLPVGSDRSAGGIICAPNPPFLAHKISATPVKRLKIYGGKYDQLSGRPCRECPTRRYTHQCRNYKPVISSQTSLDKRSCPVSAACKYCGQDDEDHPNCFDLTWARHGFVLFPFPACRKISRQYSSQKFEMKLSKRNRT